MADVGRDTKTGRLLPGHAPMFFNHKPGSGAGRPKSLKTKVRNALAIAEDKLPQMFLDEIGIAEVMRAKALAGDIKAAAVFHEIRRDFTDRIYGKPSQPLAGLAGRPIEIVVTYEGSGQSAAPGPRGPE